VSDMIERMKKKQKICDWCKEPLTDVIWATDYSKSKDYHVQCSFDKEREK